MRVNQPAGAPDLCVRATDFESMPHRELLGLLDGVDQARATAVAADLGTAAADIGEIASDLRRCLGRLDWQSPAGDAFRAWGNEVAGATSTLADYTATAGDHMANAAATLHDVRRDIPPVPQNAVATVATYRVHEGVYGPFGDAAEGVPATPGMATPTAAQYRAALAAMARARLAAADQMTKLGSAYSVASDAMRHHEQPRFPAMPGAVMPENPETAKDSQSTFVYTAAGARERSGGRNHDSAVSRSYGRGTDVHSGPTLAQGTGIRRPTGEAATHDPRTVAGRSHGSGAPLPSTTTGPPAARYAGGVGRPGVPEPNEPESTGPAPRGPGRSAAAPVPDEGIVGGRRVDRPGGGPIRFSLGNVIGEEPPAGRRGAGTAPIPPPVERTTSPQPGPTGGTPAPARGLARSGVPPFYGGPGEARRAGRRRPDYLVEEDETWRCATHTVPPVVE